MVAIFAESSGKTLPETFMGGNKEESECADFSIDAIRIPRV
jgi:hypothetical protein